MMRWKNSRVKYGKALTYENLKVDELIPLPGHPDLFVGFKVLLGYEKAGSDEYFDGCSFAGPNVSIKSWAMMP